MKGEGLKVELADGKLTISVPVETLCLAATRGPYFDDIVVEHDQEVEVTDPQVFAEAIKAELLREEEDGTTLIHRMFDKAAINAVEGGAEGIRIPGVD